ncbi:MAG TPA: NAD(P)/FAD-dependent oxidoreductase [Anaerolineae bacterium]|nr:NAD(P)/FAD-dependent oxidoreductase [Anaerolineae bacterium]HNU03644.1 NAD(P)/FAD-dependent oxidoreductase [Anaerolineae bacterium]
MTHSTDFPEISARSTLGVVGLPMPARELAARRWDVIVVGAGHNGLACAAYLARAGKQVLVLEARERVGGACTLEEPWPGFRVSPCAYLCGLLHPLVIEELDFPAWGYHWTPATAGMFVPFEDGSYVQLPEDDDACEGEIARVAPRDLAGWRAMGDVMRRARNALRPAGALGGAFSPDDLWLNPAPSREQIEERLAGDEEARGLLFQWSMAEYVERYLSDERLQMAYLGQGVIGAFASPFDPGTASISFHHSSGRLGGLPGMWGYVRGGMGMVSFILCDIARGLGATVAAGVPVARILPGAGVELMGGERIHAPVVVSNADPRTTLALLGDAADPAWRAQVEAVPIEGCSMKVSVALAELPNFTAKPGVDEIHHRGQINTPLTKDEWRRAYAVARAGGLPDRLWTELYFQTAFDDSVAPAGAHLMSVFAQYVPYNFTQGDWDDPSGAWRARAGQVALESIARFCSNLPDAILHYEVIGPRDIEQRVGLAGGHIFQGEILPQHMWDQRLAYQTPMPGVYLCGAATHPGGSVIAVNGRNAASVVLGERLAAW